MRNKAFILNFFIPQIQNGIPHFRAKTCKVLRQFFGYFIFIPPPLEGSKILNTKLGVQVISSKRRKKWYLDGVVPQHKIRYLLGVNLIYISIASYIYFYSVSCLYCFNIFSDLEEV